MSGVRPTDAAAKNSQPIESGIIIHEYSLVKCKMAASDEERLIEVIRTMKTAVLYFVSLISS